MPGILYHQAFAEKLARIVYPNNVSDEMLFMAGNQIPDLALNKSASHYRIPAAVKGFLIPDMDQVKKELFNLDNPLIFGMYCHLYLDEKFIKNFIIPSFIWDNVEQKVINPRNSMQWDVNTFFSQKGMYGAYTETNKFLIQDGHISLDVISKIPDLLPMTGIPAFDCRKEETWRAELERYNAEERAYTGNIFIYEEMWNCIETAAEELEEELHVKKQN